jgi:hypothetical protein
VKALLRSLLVVFATAALLAAQSSPALAHGHWPPTKPKTYLALGDSLAVGQQPDVVNGQPKETPGYVTQVGTTSR